MNQNQIIATPRLRLRPWREGDRDAFAAMHADPAVMVDTRRLDRDESDAKLDRYAAAFARLGFCRWALETPDGDFVGYTGVMPARETHPLGPHSEMGWRLVRAAWGKGYATEAAQAALGDVFRRVGLPDVLAYTAPDNIRSQAVMARLGLRRDPERDFTANDGEAPWTGLVWVARPG
jgi:RimJ/RimL family protein N-acetyltransferase